MKVIETALPGVLRIEPRVFGDSRGFFMETYNAARYQEAGIDTTLVQDNHSRSRRGVLRGLHYQLIQPQAKLVRVARGVVFDVVVDIRRGSPHFGQWVGEILDDEKHHQLYIPVGFAHGFCVLSETADFVYKCSDYYHPQSENGIAWDDPAIGIQWPEIDIPWLLSDKDRANPTLVTQSQLPEYP